MSLLGDGCTLETCNVKMTFYGYRPNLAVNDALLAMFGLSLVAHAVQACIWRGNWSFAIAMILGCLTEIIGYAGRLMLYVNPFNKNGFILQLCALTMAPAFFCAGIYICLSRIVQAFGPQHSRISPKQYMYIFIPCDVIALSVQGTGAGMASVAFNHGHYSHPGNNLLLAGLIFQVASLVVFMGLCLDFAIQVWMRSKKEGLDTTSSNLAGSPKFRGFVAALIISTVCILVRSIYRVIEKRGGWTGHLMKDEKLFIILEGFLVTISVVILNAFHPGMGMGPRATDRKYLMEEKEQHDSISSSSRHIMIGHQMRELYKQQNDPSRELLHPVHLRDEKSRSTLSFQSDLSHHNNNNNHAGGNANPVPLFRLFGTK